ncbi:colanic acid biosynthesis acetyltransferase WcaF [filamentous cyanobacterium LEGE 11480]|uniref:Colanic acid biosynthesis acetyltransferase WcaF n=1 Tax=Romeriopsis navalis LEGE 11480 TaxID=2777977 RepID=A0A928VJM3_9CYAN|nr:WcaF family extracellular polysaccharide biosynthesis acetyltransferase [Romeriopsis navalis]MBE9029811.1 colanic acid biosynthesis acetyltransferase WcaF [Romeriopsis navalis LEGE 11480]
MNVNVVKLNQYRQGDYAPGAALWLQLLWYFLGAPLVRSYWLPVSGLKVLLLRMFGATIGTGVRIKPGVRVKFPWRLTVGDHVWIGEDAWFDNLAPITIGDHVCISQAVYLCTGNHDWTSQYFDLKIAPITIEAGAWVAARSVIGPGVTVGQGAILALGSTTGRSLLPMLIYAGSPATAIKSRVMTAQNSFVPVVAT